MNKICSILKDIEEVRDRLHKCAEGVTLVHPDILKISQELDQLIVEYFRLKASK